MAKNSKINFNELVSENNFEVDQETSSSSTNYESSNFLSPKEDEENQSIFKKSKKTKEYQYKKIFDDSLKKHSKITNSVHIYTYNMDKIRLLNTLNSNVKITEIVNYIINDFFAKHSEEIKEENKNYSSELNKNL